MTAETTGGVTMTARTLGPVRLTARHYARCLEGIVWREWLRFLS